MALEARSQEWADVDRRGRAMHNALRHQLPTDRRVHHAFAALAAVKAMYSPNENCDRRTLSVSPRCNISIEADRPDARLR